VLALRMKRDYFVGLLAAAVPSSFGASRDLYADEHEWKSASTRSDVRLQWDPDHGLAGNKVERRAIQLGICGAMLEGFRGDAFLGIEDVSAFVAEQRANISPT